jgi:6-pyruvoyltetrahydropterin/6-carboxytetrahydropterin synthase
MPDAAHLSSQPTSSVRALAGVVYVTRQVHFNAAHRLHNPDKNDAWNQAVFGVCNNPRWHGHNYVLEVTVRGVPNPETGYVIDLGELKQLLQDVILTPCDHRNLNEEVAFLRGVIPTAENLAIAFWNELAPRLPSGQLHRIRLYETDRNFADYFGPSAS